MLEWPRTCVNRRGSAAISWARRLRAAWFLWVLLISVVLGLVIGMLLPIIARAAQLVMHSERIFNSILALCSGGTRLTPSRASRRYYVEPGSAGGKQRPVELARRLCIQNRHGRIARIETRHKIEAVKLSCQGDIGL